MKSPVLVCEAVTNAQLQASLNNAIECSEDKENQQKRFPIMDKQEILVDEGWRLVTTRSKRRKSGSGYSAESSDKQLNKNEQLMQKRSTMNVYERLASGVLRPPNLTQRTVIQSDEVPSGGRGLMFPRCAMDLPQTKASMAKIAYSRQLLWKKHQSLLVEKLQKRRRRDFQYSRKTVSVPSLSAINFADPIAVKRSAEAFKSRQKVNRLATSKISISHDKEQKDFESIEEVLIESEDDRENHCGQNKCLPTEKCSRSEPPPNFSFLPDGMDADDEWRAMTEEENSLVQEEQSLKKEIEEEENLSIDAELERQVSNEAAAVEEMERMEETKAEKKITLVTWQDVINNWKKEMEKYASISWSEIVEREITHYRKPGELAQIHEKLSSPSRKRNLENATKKQEERQQRAEELRQKLQEEKANRLKDLSNKVEEVRRKRELLFERKKEHLQKRMAKAEENRQKSLDEIVKKARDDDVKVMEIQFINALEADNMRYDVMARNQEWEQRMQTLAEERAKKNGEKAAKESAAEERRRNAEIQRTEKLLEKRARKAQCEVQRLEQERERVTAVKKKQQEVSERVAEKKAIEAAENEKLRQKIQRKQEETRRRYENALIHVKQRAVELSSPRPFDSLSNIADFCHLLSEEPYVNGVVAAAYKSCKICDVQVKSDLDLMAHLLSSCHLSKKNMDIMNVTNEILKSDLENCIINVDMEDYQCTSIGLNDDSPKSSTGIKKRRNRIRQKLITKSKIYESLINRSNDLESFLVGTEKTSADRCIREISKILKETLQEVFIQECCNGIVQNNCIGKSLPSSSVHTLERNFSDLLKTFHEATLEKRNAMIKSIWNAGLIDTFLALISCCSSGETIIPSRTYCKVVSILTDLLENVHVFLRIFYSNRILVLIDACSIKLKLLIARVQGSEQVKTIALGDSCNRFLIECYLLHILLGRLFKLLPFMKCSLSLKNFLEDGENELDRAKLIMSLLATNGFGHSFAFFIEQTGISSYLPWLLQLDSDIVVVPYTFFTQIILNFVEVCSLYGIKSYRESSPDSVCGDTSEKNISLIASLVEPTLRRLICRIYSMLALESACESNSSTTHASISAKSVISQRDEFDPFQQLVLSFSRLWCVLVRHDPTEAKSCILDNSLSLRMVQIWAHLLAQAEKNLQSLTSGTLKKSEKQKFTESLHLLIFAIGYFASVHPHAQIMCVLGWQRSLLTYLCSLPFVYFSNSALTAILMPTLIAICFQNKLAVDLIKPTLSTKVFETFLKDADFATIPENMRFPKKIWPEAIIYFQAV